MSKKDEATKFKNYDEKKSPLMIYANFESILAPENNGKQNLDVSFASNVKIMFLVVMVTNYYVLMINLTNFLSHI